MTNLDHFGIECKLCTESRSLSLDLEVLLGALNPVYYLHYLMIPCHGLYEWGC